MRPVESPSRRVHPEGSTVERGSLHRLERGERRISEHEEVLEETEPTPTQRYRASVLAQIDKVVLQPSQPPPSQKAVARFMAQHRCSSMEVARKKMIEVAPLTQHAADTVAEGDQKHADDAGFLSLQPCLAAFSLFSKDHDPLLPRSRTLGRTAGTMAPPRPQSSVGHSLGNSGGARLYGTDADCKFYSFGGLLHSVAVGAIRPVRGSYLVRLWRGGDFLAPRQALPPEAFWSADQLERLLRACQAAHGHKASEPFGALCVAVCHRWLSDGSPEPEPTSRFQLSRVARFAETYLRAVCAPLFAALERAGQPSGVPDCAVFWPFASLYQPHASPSQPHQYTYTSPAYVEPPLSQVQLSLSEEGKRWSALWFGHAHTVLWVQPEVDSAFATLHGAEDAFDMHRDGGVTSHRKSGWATLELALAGFLKPSHKRLDVSRHPTSRPECFNDGSAAGDAAAAAWWRDTLVPLCALPPGAPPQLPERFSRVLLSKRTFSHAAEAEMAVQMYADFFAAATRMAPALECAGRSWGVAQMRVLAELLPHCVRCRALDLSGNPLGAEGGALLVRALAKPTCGITRLDVRHTGLPAECVRALLEIRRLKSIALAPLNLYGARQALALEVLEGQMPHQPRLVLEPDASEQRALDVLDDELRGVQKALKARHAHQLGWVANRQF
jgi:hypothetical protein